MYPNLNPTPSAPPAYAPTNLPDKRRKPSSSGETIFCIALSALSFFVSHITKYQNPGLSNFCRVLPAGILVIWFLRRINNSINSSDGNHHRHSRTHYNQNYYNPIFPSIIFLPPSTESSYSGPSVRHRDSISYCSTNPSNTSFSRQHPVPDSRSSNYGGFHSRGFEHETHQSRNPGHKDTIRYQPK